MEPQEQALVKKTLKLEIVLWAIEKWKKERFSSKAGALFSIRACLVQSLECYLSSQGMTRLSQALIYRFVCLYHFFSSALILLILTRIRVEITHSLFPTSLARLLISLLSKSPWNELLKYSNPYYDQFEFWRHLKF